MDVVECILGIIDSYGVVYSKVVYEYDNPLEYVHEEIWPISGRGKRWRLWHINKNKIKKIEKSDKNESFLNNEDKELIISHLQRRYGIISEKYYYTS